MVVLMKLMLSPVGEFGVLGAAIEWIQRNDPAVYNKMNAMQNNPQATNT